MTSSRHLAQRLSRLLAPGGAAALPAVALALLSPGVASAIERPTDAPEVDARTPALPPEYLVVETEWASVGYHPSARERVRALLPQLDAIRDRLRATTGADALSGVEIRIAALALEMQHLSPGDADVAGRAITFPRQKLVVVAAEPQDAGDDDLVELVTHGLAHLALAEATHGRPVPAWFAEGFADASSGTASRERIEALALAALRRDVPSIDALDRDDPDVSPIARRAVAADLVVWLEERGSGTGVAAYAAGIAREATPRRALEAAAGTPLDGVERGHRESLARRFGFAPVLLLAAMAWLIMATISLARRARRALALRRVDGHSDPPPPQPRVRRRTVSLVARASRDSSAAQTSAAHAHGDAVSTDPGVPKVRRDGGWHTLH